MLLNVHFNTAYIVTDILHNEKRKWCKYAVGHTTSTDTCINNVRLKKKEKELSSFEW